MVNLISETVDKIYLPTLPGNLITLQCLYQDNPKVEVFVTNENRPDSPDIQEYSKKYKLITCWDCGYRAATMYRDYYNSANIDPQTRYTHFKLPQHIPNQDFVYREVVKQEPYALIINVCSGGIKEFQVKSHLPFVYIKPGLTENALDYIKVIENASEIHTIDGAFYHLIESIKVKAKLYFYHARYSEPGMLISPSEKWIVP